MFTLLLMSSCQEWQFHTATDNYVVRNGNFTFLLTCGGQELAVLHCLLTSSGQEWQFYIATDTYVVKIGSFTLATDN